MLLIGIGGMPDFSAISRSWSLRIAQAAASPSDPFKAVLGTLQFETPGTVFIEDVKQNEFDARPGLASHVSQIPSELRGRIRQAAPSSVAEGWPL
jgi:hypothetical protein